MKTAIKVATIGKAEGIPPRERILAVAADLFYRHGIRAVGVEAIAEAAGTNKMTLYRHFASKDELVAAYLRCLAEKASASWDKLAAQHAGDPRAQLRAWLENMAGHVGSGGPRAEALHESRRRIDGLRRRFIGALHFDVRASRQLRAWPS